MVERDESQQRGGVKINLSREALEIVTTIREDTGVPNTEAMTRILEWFASLDRELRIAILTRNQATRDQLLADALHRQLARKGLVADVDFETATATAIELIKLARSKHASAAAELRDLARESARRAGATRRRS